MGWSSLFFGQYKPELLGSFIILNSKQYKYKILYVYVKFNNSFLHNAFIC